MAILAAVVLPLLGGSGVSTAELKSAARQVAAGLRVARSEALATHQETRVVLDLEQRTFRIDRDTRVHALPRPIEVKLFTAQSDLVNERARTTLRHSVNPLPHHASFSGIGWNCGR